MKGVDEMTILLTGIDGYIGWPTALGLARRFPDRRIVGIDNGARRRWVAEVGADTVVPISAPEERMRAAREHGLENLSWVEGDMTDASFVRRLVRVHRPEAVAHLAAQPSAPYSQIGLEAANLTQFNNNQSTRTCFGASTRRAWPKAADLSSRRRRACTARRRSKSRRVSWR